MAMSCLPAASAHSAPLLVNGPLLQVADNDDFAASKDAYLQKTRAEMSEWQKGWTMPASRPRPRGMMRARISHISPPAMPLTENDRC